jgi:uncharacterized protein
MKDFGRAMSPETFILFYQQWIQQVPDNTSCDIIWHGGEPTLRGINFFEDVFIETSRLTPESKIVSHAMQTNGVTITRRWADFFAQYNIQVGVSIDGPEGFHDAFRITSTGSGTFKKAFSAYRLLREHGVTAGIVVVVNKLNVGHPEKVFDFMLESGIKRLQLSPCLESNADDDSYSITAGAYAKFICRLYDIWIEHDDPEISIGYIEDVVKHLMGLGHDNCMLLDRCRQFAVLDWTGELRTCDGMRNRQLSVGHVENGGVAAKTFPVTWKGIHDNLSQMRTSTCNACEWYPVCHGGCPYHWPDGGEQKTRFCEDNKKIFAHIATSLRDVL